MNQTVPTANKPYSVRRQNPSAVVTMEVYRTDTGDVVAECTGEKAEANAQATRRLANTAFASGQAAAREEVAALTREREAARNEARAAGALIDTFVFDRSDESKADSHAKQDRLWDEWRAVRTDYVSDSSIATPTQEGTR
jgi:hypothetical protein